MVVMEGSKEMISQHHEPPIYVGDLIITPVVEVRQQTTATPHRVWSYGVKEPVAPIIDSPSGRQTLYLDRSQPPNATTTS